MIPPEGRDVGEFERLYRTHFHDVVAWLIGKGAPDRDALDVAQLVFLTAWQRLPDIPKPSKEARAWLLGAAKNHLRTYWRSLGVVRLFAEDALPHASDDGLLEQRLVKAQLIAKAIDAMADGPNRNAFVAIDIEGKRTEQYAEETNANEATVRSALSRGRAEFREAYQRLHDEEPALDVLDAATIAMIAFLLGARVRVLDSIEQILAALDWPVAARGAATSAEMAPQRVASKPSPPKRLPRALLAFAALPLLLPLLPRPTPEEPVLAESFSFPAIVPPPALGSAPSADMSASNTSDAPPNPRVPSTKRQPQRSGLIAPTLEAQREAERNLLRQAASLLVRKDPAGALVVLHEHAAKYPDSRFAEDRDSYIAQAEMAIRQSKQRP